MKDLHRTMLRCIRCDAENEASAILCAWCGSALSDSTLNNPPIASVQRTLHKAHLGKLVENTIALYINDFPQPLILRIEGALVLGRGHTSPLVEKAAPFIDLNPYDALWYGVSRNHASLCFRDGILHITDMGSSNGTWANNIRLQPFREYGLIPGSAVLLSKLAIYLYY
jgi:hypothetical protein